MSRDKKLDFKEDEFIFRRKFNVQVFLKIPGSGGYVPFKGDSGTLRLPGQGSGAFLRVPHRQAGLRISVLHQLTPKSCYPLGESTSFPPDPLMILSAIVEFLRREVGDRRELSSFQEAWIQVI